MMTSIIDTDSIRKQLEDEQEKLQESIAQKLDERDEDRNPDRSDLAQSYTSRERDTALLAMEQQQLQQIEAALQRIEDGVYGKCTECGDPIPPERLEILPYATLCVRCQSKHDTR